VNSAFSWAMVDKDIIKIPHSQLQSFNSNIRYNREKEPFGVLGDLGWYNIRFTLFAFNYEIPEYVQCNMTYSHEDAEPGDITKIGVPIDVRANLFYKNHRSASFHTSFLTDMREWVEICGTEGTLRLDDFMIPFHKTKYEHTIVNNGHLMNHERDVEKTITNRHCTSHYSQEANMFINFSNEILAFKHHKNASVPVEKAIDKKEDEQKHYPDIDSHMTVKSIHGMSWPNISLLTQTVVDACVDSHRKGNVKVQVKFTPV